VVKEVKPANDQITIEAQTTEGATTILVMAGRCVVRRYASGSVKFNSAIPSSLAEMRRGDQLRALGDRDGDGSRMNAEQIVFGTFHTIAGLVSEVGQQDRQVKVTLFGEKRQISINLASDSVIRRIPAQLGTAIGQRALFARMAVEAGRRLPATSSTSRTVRNAPSSQGADLQSLVDALPPLGISDLKTGDAIAVSFSADQVQSGVTAITVIAGLESIINAMNGQPAQRRAVLSAGLPAGVLDFGIGQP
jgi:hypothetical protein